MSIAGGLHNALLAGQAHNCPAVQLFTGTPSQWAIPTKQLADEDVALFRKTRRAAGLKKVVAHDSYLINMASPKPDLFRKSIEAFIIEMNRAEQLGIEHLVTHPGSPTDGDEETGLRAVATALDEIHQRCAGFRVRVLLETTAGQGQSLGWRFEHLARILELVAEPRRLGVCFDTCHVFAAGYALAPDEEYQKTMSEFDRLIGLRRLRVFHINDSKKPRGSRVDRHDHIGRGQMGLDPFRLLVNDPRFQDRPMILETAKEDGKNKDMDAINLATLRGLVDG
jgi:deoxyribonuclease-4